MWADGAIAKRQKAELNEGVSQDQIGCGSHYYWGRKFLWGSASGWMSSGSVATDNSLGAFGLGTFPVQSVRIDWINGVCEGEARQTAGVKLRFGAHLSVAFCQSGNVRFHWC